MAKLINVVKATGEIEPFSEEKVVSSLMRAGASKGLAYKIVDKVKSQLYQNIPTFEIYSAVMKILRREQKDLASRYSLKRAIMELGPTGYPFEIFVAGVLEADGFKVQNNMMVLGKCVSHEVDIVAKKDKKTHMVECKFHNQLGGRTEIKPALYTYARFLDLRERGFDLPWLVTNTKVTQEVRAYCLCMGMEVTSWDYPEGKSLRELVDKSDLQPLTSLTSLTKKQKQSFLEQGIVFAKDLPRTS
ncbi:MAG TPA: ATP cone domain-containing protein [Clostridia bacterium]|nr:ATP cone domain-containing protein [Clostridia bacterium]